MAQSASRVIEIRNSEISKSEISYEVKYWKNGDSVDRNQ